MQVGQQVRVIVGLRGNVRLKGRLGEDLIDDRGRRGENSEINSEEGVLLSSTKWK